MAPKSRLAGWSSRLPDSGGRHVTHESNLNGKGVGKKSVAFRPATSTTSR